MNRVAPPRDGKLMHIGAATLALVALSSSLAAQSPWNRLFPTTSPGPRDSAAMCYDSAHGQIVMFGGQVYEMGLFADTWTWNGTDWQEIATAVSPRARVWTRMVFDSLRERAVLFGGGDPSSSPFGDTWEWDGVHWTELTPSTSPAPRSSFGMAFDSNRRRVVLFGGYDWRGPTDFGDTWQWDGLDWVQAFPAISPSARRDHAMAYDSGRDRVVLYGGRFYTGIGHPATLLRDTWEWDGTTWLQRTPAHDPGLLASACMVYDPLRHRTVLFGGTDPDDLRNSTWEWDGADWTPVVQSIAPQERFEAMMAFDPQHGSSVLFGGWTRNGSADDMWEYQPASGSGSFEVFGAGCAGTNGVPTLSSHGSTPVLGEVFPLFVDNLPPDCGAVMWLGFSRTEAGAYTLPLDLSMFGMPGCTLYTSGDSTFGLFVWHSTANWGLMVPDHPALLGLAFYNQAFGIDRTANPLGLVATNASAAVIGQR